MMEPCGFQAARCGWLTMRALGRKAPPRVSHRGTHRKPRTSTVSRRGRSCATNTASPVPPLFGVRATIPLAFECAESSAKRGVEGPSRCRARPPPHASARRNAPKVSLISPRKGPNRCQSGQALFRFLTEFARVCAHSAGIQGIDTQKDRHALHGDRGAVVFEVEQGRTAGEKEASLRLPGVCFHEAFSGPLCHDARAFMQGRADHTPVALLCDEGAGVSKESVADLGTRSKDGR
ncbi:ribonuclease HI [Trypanosoma cruzi]|nr:ribonuclease HI [Trypanosoma cruzi]